MGWWLCLTEPEAVCGEGGFQVHDHNADCQAGGQPHHLQDLAPHLRPQTHQDGQCLAMVSLLCGFLCGDTFASQVHEQVLKTETC